MASGRKNLLLKNLDPLNMLCLIQELLGQHTIAELPPPGWSLLGIGILRPCVSRITAVNEIPGCFLVCHSKQSLAGHVTNDVSAEAICNAGGRGLQDSQKYKLPG